MIPFEVIQDRNEMVTATYSIDENGQQGNGETKERESNGLH